MQRSHRTPLTWIVALAITTAMVPARLAQPELAIGEPDQERVVRGADDRRPGLVRELGEQPADLERRRGVESRGRLVRDDDGRARGEDAGERDALALAGREQFDAALGVRGEADSREGSAARSRASSGSTPRARGRARRSRAERNPERPGACPTTAMRSRRSAARAARSERGDDDVAEADFALVGTSRPVSSASRSTCPSPTARRRPRAAR